MTILASFGLYLLIGVTIVAALIAYDMERHPYGHIETAKALTRIDQGLLWGPWILIGIFRAIYRLARSAQSLIGMDP